MCSLIIFGAWTIHGQTRIHKIHHGPDLGEATTYPLILYFVPGHKASTQMAFCSESLEISKIGTLATLKTHNFVFRPLIEMRSKAKLYLLLRAFQQYVSRHLHVRESRRFPTFSAQESNWPFDS